MNGLTVIPLVLIAAIPLAIILHRLSGRGQRSPSRHGQDPRPLSSFERSGP